MKASSRLLLGEMPKDGAPDAHRGGALCDGNAKVVAHPHRQSVEIERGLLPPHFGARLVEHRIDRIAIDDSFTHITGDLSEEDQANLARRASSLGVLIKAPAPVVGTTRFSRCAVASRTIRTTPPTACRFETITIESKSLVIE